MAVQHNSSAWEKDEFRVPPEFGSGGGEQCKWNTHDINHIVQQAYTDVFRHLDANFNSSLPVVEPHKLDNIRGMIHHGIHWTHID